MRKFGLIFVLAALLAVAAAIPNSANAYNQRFVAKEGGVIRLDHYLSSPIAGVGDPGDWAEYYCYTKSDGRTWANPGRAVAVA